MKITVKGNEYRIRYSYNCFCDSDIFDRVKEMLQLMQEGQVGDDSDMNSLGKIKDLFVLIRELFFLGLQKDNPVESLAEAGDLLDDYRDEAPDGEDRGLISIFTALTEELVNEGFLSEILNEANKAAPKAVRKSRK